MCLGFGNFFNWMPFGLGGLFFAIIIVAIVFALRGGRDRHGCCGRGWHEHSSGAEQILKERLAKGEIDEAAYESLLKKIRE